MDGSLRPPTTDHRKIMQGKTAGSDGATCEVLQQQFLRARAEEISLTAGPLRNLNSVKVFWKTVTVPDHRSVGLPKWRIQKMPAGLGGVSSG